MEIKSPLQCPNTVTVRRNPHRKARATPSTNAPQNPVPFSSSSTNVKDIPSFPIQDILSMEIPQNPQPDPSSSSSPKDPISENIKVYLRIRPLLPPKIAGRNGAVGDQNPRSRAKNAWPQNPAKKNAATDKNAKKKKSGEVCLTVNDSQSVTLSPPLALKESKRIKSEVYEGFSHVFSTDSSQGEVYERMVKPLVEDFLEGKSGMFVALGPSGSGKTHTVFGSPREPGMVPLTLQQIFKRSKCLRSFCISIFEIYSERGKGEKAYDLSPDGTELSMQQSTIRGLQEVVVSDAGQAESLIARALLKRATAMTNANSQSSRSQCIINISSVANKVDENDVQSSNAVLTIVDLAGAEREKRTGNQGARLLESNFINNTSMVFGLCLRSLLEHQKNPKRPLQKHFQNSLLTRYLRDYLEGKKRMTLILTVKAGEEDYLDSSYLLKQASPYMKIKFNNVEEPSNMFCNKRHFQALPRVEQHKRMKLSGLDTCALEEGKSIGDEQGLSVKEASRIYRVDVSDNATLKSDFVDLAQRERNHQIMQKFSKALWNVLKQYNEKLKVAESEIQSLRESLGNEKTRNLELGKELEDLKSCCICSKENSVEATSIKIYTSLESKAEMEGYEYSNGDETNVDIHPPNLRASSHNSTPEDLTLLKGWINMCSLRNIDIDAVNASCICVENSNQQTYEISDTFPGNGHNTEDINHSKYLGTEDSPNTDVTEFTVSSSPSYVMVRKDSCSSVELDQLLTEEDEESLVLSPKEDVTYTQGCSIVNLPDSEPRIDTCIDLDSEKLNSSVRKTLPASSTLPRDFSASDVEDEIEKPTELLERPLSPKVDVAFIKRCNGSDVLDSKPRVSTSCKPEKPKRRLLPASSVLLRDFSTLDVEDEIEKPKGNRGGRKLGTDERKRTQGSITLLRLLQSNLHL